MTTPADAGRARRRRRRGPKPPPVTPAAVIAEARAPALDLDAEAPMSAAEIARMKATLRFLREHRQTLKLKVNAAEDLLLNGKKEPTHRGLCQHLLSKLDRARVLIAAERMPPAQATEFLAGVVRFAPEIPYVLRFLESVKASEHPRQAAAALTQALERLDFAETSVAQMRDLLQLVVDVFPASELPVFAFSLLSGGAFRRAFDRSSEGLPASLSEVLLPLRSLHGWMTRPARGHRRPRSEGRVSREALREGARLMLGASRESLLELSEALRRQLFEAGVDALGRAPAQAASRQSGESLLALFHSFELRDAAARASAVLGLAAAFLRGGLDRSALELLKAELEARGEPRAARHWLAALEGERIGNVALERRARRDHRRDAPPDASRGSQARDSHARDSHARDASRDSHARDRQRPAPLPEPSERAPAEGVGGALATDRWHRGWHVPTQQEVLVRFAGPAAGDRDSTGAVAQPEATELLARHAALQRRLLVPGVAALVEVQSGVAQGARGPRTLLPSSYLAVAWKGPPLPRRLQEPRIEPELALGWCQEACLLLAGLAAQGFELPDAALARFSVDAAERLWLADLWLLREVAVEAAAAAHLALGRQLCRELLGALDSELLSAAAERSLGEARSLADVLAALSASA